MSVTRKNASHNNETHLSLRKKKPLVLKQKTLTSNFKSLIHFKINRYVSKNNYHF